MVTVEVCVVVVVIEVVRDVVGVVISQGTNVPSSQLSSMASSHSTVAEHTSGFSNHGVDSRVMSEHDGIYYTADTQRPISIDT